VVDKTDIEDGAIVDAIELASDGTVSFKTTSVTDVVSGLMTMNLSAPYFGLSIGDETVEPGDIFVLTGASAGDGTYVVDTVPSNDTLTATPALPDSTGGSVEFKHPCGALKVGIDPSSVPNVAATNLQTALEELGAAITISLPVPTEVGQVLFSRDGSSFELTQPIVGRRGWLTNRRGELLYGTRT
jgi:hypothetical protein